MRMLNLGCGRHCHPEWINVDHTRSVPGVIVHDLNLPLPFEDASINCIYCSHFLEHLPRARAPVFLGQCLKMLKPGGVIRLVVPDLEAQARLYLSRLEGALRGDADCEQQYDWTVIELLDQLTRERSGGEMAAYWSLDPMPAREFVMERSGAEAAEFIREWPGRGRAHPAAALAGEPVSREEHAAFRESGESHKWMYDRYSLARLLKSRGFVRVRTLGPGESSIPDFGRYNLDLTPEGLPRKPDSLYMEGIKPADGGPCAP